MAKKFDKKNREEIIIDMNDFLITYGASILGNDNKDIAQRVYEAGKNGLNNLDKLFKDNGFGRKEKYYDIGEGYISDLYHENPENITDEANKLAKEAMEYLGNNLDKFDHWKAE
ncbi:hypothetical protein [Apilactobacillus ozensis]|uniref:Uncharacterized protein n=1 Tax=Apilactobacillus ozensis DSM 23829 = JCM 17196 TaxID=1423781 RepID=A0A0R2AS08_9LACO|nr:hypothetical protein [Apilactobacillus ozensis]KRM69853.1 hypothetical protein FD06_GL000018 [Apilactobacillus ozensis DSM 23829 = JCM 17196]MCK8606740.1 hypothetical protein [Apilactobacillus ozensis]